MNHPEDYPPLPQHFADHRCYAWITPEDAIRHALAAFYSACRFHDKLNGVFPEEGSSRQEWTATFTAIFALRLDLQLAKTGDWIRPETADELFGYTEPCFHRATLDQDLQSSLKNPLVRPENPILEGDSNIHCALSKNEAAGDRAP